jgi:hypothetical protein
MCKECLLQSGNEYTYKNVNCSFFDFRKYQVEIRTPFFPPFTHEWNHLKNIFILVTAFIASRHIATSLINRSQGPFPRIDINRFASTADSGLLYWMLIHLQVRGLIFTFKYLSWLLISLRLCTTQSNVFYLHHKARQPYVIVFVSGTCLPKDLK